MNFKEMAGDGVQPADLKRMGKADAKVYVHKDGKTILVPASKKDEYMAKGYKLSALRAEDDNSSRGMNKYGLAARNKDGKFYSYRHGKLTGTFDNIKDLQKHQAELIKDESVDQDTDESGIMYKAGVKKYGKDGMKKIQSAAGKGASAEEIGKIKDQHNKK